MVRGTTPTLVFGLPFSTDIISVLYVTFVQDGEVVLEKELDDVDLDQNDIKITLTQAETLSLDADGTIEIQIRIKDDSDVAYASNIVRTDVRRILKNGEI